MKNFLPNDAKDREFCKSLFNLQKDLSPELSLKTKIASGQGNRSLSKGEKSHYRRVAVWVIV